MALFNAVPLNPRTDVFPKTVYLILQPGPPAVLAAVSFCGDGEKTPGCFNTAVVQLPAFKKFVSVTIKLTPLTLPAMIKVKVSAVRVRLMTILDGDLVENLLLPAVTEMAPGGSV